LKILGIIPARYDSARFPGKPLAMTAGKTMIQRVYEQCKKAKSLTNVIVATDDDRIAKEVERFGGIVWKSVEQHQNGTSRCAEVAENCNSDPRGDFRYNYVINIQGDEPLINPNQIDELASIFKNKNIPIATQVKKETDLSLLDNKNIVKAILDENNFAIDFKRIIDDKKLLAEIFTSGFFYKHIGIYGFKTNLLVKLVNLAPTKNELDHHLEQLRWLDYGFKIKAGITEYESISVDTKEDLEKVIKALNP
jgi:3-deoxy-manno-octulosonate cytidylyltransferase (CMP-KDO synthetase)